MIACSCTGTHQTDKEDIKIGVLRGPSAVAFAQIINQEIYIQGHKLVVELINSPDIIQARLIKNDVDIAVLPMINAANLYNKGVHYRLQGCPIWGTLYLVSHKEMDKVIQGETLYLFGLGTTPDILTRYYLSTNGIPISKLTLNYAFPTARETMQALLIKKAQTAVLSEPFLSMALQKDSTLHIIADLNCSGNQIKGYAQTAIVTTTKLNSCQSEIDSLLSASCRFDITKPQEAIRILEQKKVFPEGMLTPESIKRCMINYLPAHQIKKEVTLFLDIIYKYEPKALGGKLPDSSFISCNP